MAEINAPTLVFIGLASTLSLVFLTYHTHRYDHCRCLVPRKKDWFRCLLVYMLFLSNACFVIWAGGWTYVKVQLGMVSFGPQGARPWPSALFPDKYRAFNPPLTVMFGACYGLQACLTVEEALYWAHLHRAVRRPQTAVPFLSSYFFKAWVFISISILGIQQGVPWMGDHKDLEAQLSRELLAGGIIEMGVLLASVVVVLRFPKFLKEIEALGVGPDVRIRLYTYNQHNRTRTLLRFFFSVIFIIFGWDGLTGKIVNTNSLATDFLACIIGASLAGVMMISIVLYLPRSTPNSSTNKVMVGHQAPHAAHGTSGFALMSLLREGGQWEGLDDDLALEESVSGRRASVVEDAPFAAAKTRAKSWDIEGEEKWEDHGRVRPEVPRMLADFCSPIAVTAETPPQGPIRIQMTVEREIHKD